MTRTLAKAVAIAAFGTAALTALAAQAQEINFGIIATDAASVQRERWEPFFRDMEKKTGLTVKSFYAPDYAGVIEAMRFNKIQVAWYCNKAAMEAVDRANGEILRPRWRQPARHAAQKGILQFQSHGSVLAVRHPKMLAAAGDAMGLANEACLPCLEGAPTLTEQEISKLLEELPGWEVVDHHHLRKAWCFTDFRSALDWVNRAGAICESQGHHAEFGLGWGHAEALIYTHKVDGLTRADAVLAARFEAMDAKNPYGAFVTDR